MPYKDLIIINNEKRLEKEKMYVKINKGIDSGEIIIISAAQYILSFQPRNIFNINAIFISI